jgi:hypothetical protein
MGFRARSVVSRGPVLGAVLFHFRKELISPQVFQLNLDVFGYFIKPVNLALHSDGGDGGF